MTKHHSLTPKKCPPKDATSPNGVYCRIIFHDPPTSEDFLLWVLEPKNRHRLEEKTRKCDCSAFAISMFTEKGVLRVANMFQRAMKKKARTIGTSYLGVAKVKLDLNSGVLKQTGRVF